MRNILFRGRVHWETFIYFLISVFFGMLPLILAALISRSFSIWNGWAPFWENGELYLYSVGFFGTSMYVFMTRKRGSADFAAIAVWICIASSIFSAVLYAALATSLIKEVQGIQFDKVFLFKTSVSFLILSLAAYYVSAYMERIYREVDVADEERSAINSIIERLN